jgi:hypothetical protein
MVRRVDVPSRISFPFSHNYCIERVDLPFSEKSHLEVHYFSGPVGEKLGDWRLAIEIRTVDGPSWVGVFGGGYNSKVAYEGIMSTPDPSQVLVVAQGQPFLVSVNDPTSVVHPPCYPVTQILVVPTQSIIALADFNGIACIGKKGLIWVNNEVADDDVRLLGFEDGAIRAQGFVAPRNTDMQFRIDILTGKRLDRDLN